MISEYGAGEVITTTDLSPFPDLTLEQDQWLRSLLKAVDADELTLSLGKSNGSGEEPIAVFDGKTSSWWAGRFVGEIHYQNKTLRILPRFGMPALMRWLSHIWGVRIHQTKGTYQSDRIWLWEVLARLWASRLLDAAKHGLPISRVEETHVGRTARGRLKIRETALALRTGQEKLVSVTRNRKVNVTIGGTILSALDVLRNQLKHIGDDRIWLTERGKSLTDSFRANVSKKEVLIARSRPTTIRYTPITESYRSVVELSRSIIRQEPISSSGQGSKDVFGVLLDMAEIWELFVYHLLKGGLTGVDVQHSGRSLEASSYLLKSVQASGQLAALKPDVLIHEFSGNRCLSIIDAKYKKTSYGSDRQQGVVREDLYQMAAYLSAFGAEKRQASAALVYPNEAGSLVTSRQEPKNPWQLTSAPGKDLYFFTIDPLANDQKIVSESETRFISSVQHVVEKARKSSQQL